MRFAIDVAYCDGELEVLKVRTLVPNRLGPLVWPARAVIEAEAGSFERWGLRPGAHLEIRGGP